MNLIWVALAGGLGAVVRFGIDSLMSRHDRLPIPFGTWTINVSGSLLMGLLGGWIGFHGPLGDLGTIVGTGFLGGYTTFSAASLEAARLVREGQGWRALLHSGSMLVAAVAACALGVLVMSL